MLLIGINTSLTKNPMKPMIKNPTEVACAIFANSARWCKRRCECVCVYSFCLVQWIGQGDWGVVVVVLMGASVCVFFVLTRSGSGGCERHGREGGWMVVVVVGGGCVSVCAGCLVRVHGWAWDEWERFRCVALQCYLCGLALCSA